MPVANNNGRAGGVPVRAPVKVKVTGPPKLAFGATPPKAPTPQRIAGPIGRQVYQQMRQSNQATPRPLGPRVPARFTPGPVGQTQAGVERQRIAQSPMPKPPDMKALAKQYMGKPVSKVPKPTLNSLIKAGLVDPISPRIGYVAEGQQMSSIQAPALKILQQTTRPIHAIAGGVDAAIQGRNVLKGVSKGFSDANAPGFAKVLKDLGAPKAVQGVGGFVGDVALDPTTYLTMGTASIGEHAAADAAARVATKAVKSGMSEAGAQTVAKRAGQAAAAAAPEGKGLTVSFNALGKRATVPGVTKGTAAVGRAVKGAAAKVPAPVKTVAAGGREVARDFRPQFAPAGVAADQFQAVRAAGRQTRAGISNELRNVDLRSQAVAHAIKPAEHQQVIDAIEKGQLGALPDHLVQPARFLRDQFRHAQRLRRQAGIAQGHIQDYFPHANASVLEAGHGAFEDLPVTVEGVGRRTIRPAGSQQRQIKGTIGEINQKTPGLFSTNVPLVYNNYMRQTVEAAQRSKLNRSLADLGRPIKPGQNIELAPGESVFHIKGSNIRELNPKGDAAELGKVAQSGHAGKGGQYFVANSSLINHQLATVQGAGARSATGKVVDSATRGFKRLATSTPAFNARNMAGDAQMAYLGQPFRRLVPNTVTAVRTVHALNRLEKAQKNLERPGFVEPSGKTVKIAGQRPVPIEDFAREVNREGVPGSGQIGREVQQDLKASAGSGAKDTATRRAARFLLPQSVGAKIPAKVSTTGTGSIDRLLRNREAIMRIATYKHGRDIGQSAAKAGSRSMDYHIDYADLSPVERNFMRRVMPFYTFSARSLPIHAKALVQTPGKFANFQKLRENASTLAGLPPGWENNTPEFTQRQTPVPANLPGVFGGKGPKLLNDSLPLNILNELPVSANPVKYAKEIGGGFVPSLLNPLLKDPGELIANYSTYFRKPIQDPNHPLVSAPDWVTKLPKGIQHSLGVTTKLDRVSGKQVPAWPGRASYILQALGPGLLNQANQLAQSGSNQRGQNTAGKVLGDLTGIKADQYDPVGNAVNMAFTRLNQIQTQLHALNQRGIKGRSGHPTYAKLLDEQKTIEQAIRQSTTNQGYKVPLFQKPGRKGGGSLTSNGWGGSGTSSANGWG